MLTVGFIGYVTIVLQLCLNIANLSALSKECRQSNTTENTLCAQSTQIACGMNQELASFLVPVLFVAGPMVLLMVSSLPFNIYNIVHHKTRLTVVSLIYIFAESGGLLLVNCFIQIGEIIMSIALATLCFCCAMILQWLHLFKVRYERQRTIAFVEPISRNSEEVAVQVSPQHQRLLQEATFVSIR